MLKLSVKAFLESPVLFTECQELIEALRQHRVSVGKRVVYSVRDRIFFPKLRTQLINLDRLFIRN